MEKLEYTDLSTLKLSVGNDITLKYPQKMDMPLSWIFNEIATDEVNKNNIEYLRTLTDEKEIKSHKKKLHFFTPSGTFEKTRGAINFVAENVELVCIDYDEVKDIEALMSQIKALPETVMCFRSPCDGVKCLIRVEKGCNDYHSIWNSVKVYMTENVGHKIDDSGKDISRTCFFSHDPDTYFNPKARPLPVKLVERPKVVESTHSSSSEEYDENELIEALYHINSDDYQTWLSVGMALKSCGEQFKYEWDNWSRQSKKFNKSQNDTSWKSFKATGRRYTHKTIFYLALSNGWESKKKIKKDKIREMENAQNTNNTQVNDDDENDVLAIEIAKKFLYCTSSNEIVDKTTMTSYSTSVGHRKGICNYVMTTNSRLLNNIILRMEEIDRIVTWWNVTGVTEYGRKKYFSQWRAPKLSENNEPTTMDKEVAVEKLQKFLVANYGEYGDFILKWMARCVHGGDRRVMWGLALYGDKGSGKTIIYDLIKEMIGIENCLQITPENADDSKNGSEEGKRVVNYEEIKSNKKEASVLAETLRSKVTSNEVCIRAMYKDKVMVPNKTYYIQTTNHLDGFAIQENDSRWLVLESNFKCKNRICINENDSKVLEEVVDVLLHHIQALYNGLKDIETEGLPEKAPSTSTYEIMNESKLDYSYETVGEFLEGFPDNCTVDFVSDTGEFTPECIPGQLFLDWARKKGRMFSQGMLTKVFKHYGYEKKKPYFNRKQVRCWVKIQNDEVKESVTPKKMFKKPEDDFSWLDKESLNDYFGK